MRNNLIGVGLCAALVVVHVGCAEQEAPEDARLIGSVAPSVRSKPGESRTWTFAIRNLSRDLLRLRIAAKSCSCLEAGLSVEELVPGGSAEARVSTTVNGASPVQGWVVVAATNPAGEEQFEKLSMVADIELPTGLTVAPRKVQAPASGVLVVDCRLGPQSSDIDSEELLSSVQVVPQGEVESITYWKVARDGGLGFGLRVVLPSPTNVECVRLELPGVDCAQATIEFLP